MDLGTINRWMDEGEREARDSACPVPALLFSMRSSVGWRRASGLEWLADAELQSIRKGLNHDARLMDLTNEVVVLDPAFWDLITTEGLITDISKRPKDPIPGGHFIYSRHIDDMPPWEFFWLRNLPVPDSLRPMAFTRELLAENTPLSRGAVRRFFNSQRASISFIHENTL